jgi:cephalosporin-C deacetylase-like acetyl esterase
MENKIGKIEKLVLKGSSGRDIIADCTYPEELSNVPLVIFCHGFKGFKDWGHFNLMADEFAKKGIAFLKFNFSHNGGTIEDPIDFPDLNAFGENDFVKELEDMKVVTDTVFNSSAIIEGQTEFKELLSKIDNQNITMIGHSRGGGMATIFCETEKRIKNLVLLAAVSDFTLHQPPEEVMSYWEQQGVVYIENGRTKQQMPMFFSFAEVFKENIALLNIERACSNVQQNTLVVQGLDDEVVLPTEAKSLVSWIEGAESIFVDKSNHSFGSTHPYTGSTLPGETDKVVGGTISFIKAH